MHADGCFVHFWLITAVIGHSLKHNYGICSFESNHRLKSKHVSVKRALDRAFHIKRVFKISGRTFLNSIKFVGRRVLRFSSCEMFGQERGTSGSDPSIDRSHKEFNRTQTNFQIPANQGHWGTRPHTHCLAFKMNNPDWRMTALSLYRHLALQ